jgi:hypothetical protein
VPSYTSGSRGTALYLDKSRKKFQSLSLSPSSDALVSSVTESRLSVLSKTERELENTSRSYFHDKNKTITERDQDIMGLLRAYRGLLDERVRRSGCGPETVRTFRSLRTLYSRTGQNERVQTLRTQFEMLLKKEFSSTLPGVTTMDLFHLAALSGTPDVLQFLVDTGSSVNEPFISELNDYHQYTALHFAVSSANTVAIHWLLQNGADVSAMTATGQTSLHIALSNSPDVPYSHETVRLLVTNGSKRDSFLNAADGKGTTALDLAKKAGLHEIVELLKKHGATENSRAEVRSLPYPKLHPYH